MHLGASSAFGVVGGLKNASPMTGASAFGTFFFVKVDSVMELSGGGGGRMQVPLIVGVI